MTDSILLSTKEKLSLPQDYEVFDGQIIDFINTALSTVTQLGIGPPTGYSIVDQTDVWDDLLLGDKNLNSVKSYVYLKVRLLFDPPTNSFAIEAFEKQLQELEWRLNTYREGEAWVPPTPEEPDEL